MNPAPKDRPPSIDGSAAGPSPAELCGLTDLCVKCGLCLPHCPTYGLSRQEGDSPRGRIALIQGLAAGRLGLDERLDGHLAGCLTCRSCETVCPAKVPYGEILDRGKALVRSRGGKPESGTAAVRWLARRPSLLRAAPRLLWLGRRLGLAALGRRIAPGHWLTRALGLQPAPAAAPRPGEVYEPAGPPRGDVSLFLGCISPGLDGATLTAAVTAATALGFRVRVPAGQGCCGALDLHAGRLGAAQEAARRNARAFGGGDEPILCAATGCAVTLAESGGHDDAATAVSRRAEELTHFLVTRLGDRALSGPRRRERVAVHVSCTAGLLPGRGEQMVGLLARIPNLEPVRLTAARCCGAAGHHFLTRAEQADALAEPLLEELAGIAPDRVVSANVGCALHLAAGLARRGAGGEPTPVVHPATLLARALTGGW